MLYWQDIRYAFRTLRKAPWFTGLTVLVLGGGLGIAIFTFSLLYTAMLRPLPVEGGEAIVRVQLQSEGRTRGVDAVDLVQLRSQLAPVAELGAFSGRELVVGEGDARQVIQATATEWNLFAVTRTAPARGRVLRPADHEPGADPVIVLSDWTWRTVFGADPDILDRRVLMNGISTAVVGIAPPGFGFPVASQAWVPLESGLMRGAVPVGRLVDVY
ncbi:MAG: ABC transporter permease, partial [Gemmatimonadales bacterium]